MLQALTIKIEFVFQGLVYNHRYLTKLERLNTSLRDSDKAEITTSWLIYNR